MTRLGVFVFIYLGVFGSLSFRGLAQEGPPPASPPESSVSQDMTPQQLHFQLMRAIEQMDPYKPLDELKGTVDYRGSVTMLGLGKRWSQQFKQFHPTVEFQGTLHGSEDALRALAENPSLIVGITRQVDESDLKMLVAGNCKEPVAIVIGIEAMAMYVNKSNPIPNATQEMFRDIFSDADNGKPKAQLWSDVSVAGELAKESIVTFQRDDNSGTQIFLSRIVLGGAPLAPANKIVATNREVVESIAKDPRGIGIADMNCDVPGVRKVPLSVDGHVIEANEQNVLTGRYPLVRPMLLIFDKSQAVSDGKLRETIVRFVLSRDGQSAVMASGFYPVDSGFAADQLAQVFGQQVR